MIEAYKLCMCMCMDMYVHTQTVAAAAVTKSRTSSHIIQHVIARLSSTRQNSTQSDSTEHRLSMA